MLLQALDNLFYRFEEAYKSFKNPNRTNDDHFEGRAIGKLIAFAQVQQQLDLYDPYQFENAHFKMGYYYAYEQAKKVMPDDNGRNSLD